MGAESRVERAAELDVHGAAVDHARDHARHNLELSGYLCKIVKHYAKRLEIIRLMIR